MTNLIARLTARTMGAMPVVHPRLLPLFAHDQPGMGGPAEAIATVEGPSGERPPPPSPSEESASGVAATKGTVGASGLTEPLLVSPQAATLPITRLQPARFLEPAPAEPLPPPSPQVSCQQGSEGLAEPVSSTETEPIAQPSSLAPNHPAPSAQPLSPRQEVSSMPREPVQWHEEGDRPHPSPISKGASRVAGGDGTKSRHPGGEEQAMPPLPTPPPRPTAHDPVRPVPSLREPSAAEAAVAPVVAVEVAQPPEASAEVRPRQDDRGMVASRVAGRARVSHEAGFSGRSPTPIPLADASRLVLPQPAPPSLGVSPGSRGLSDPAARFAGAEHSLPPPPAPVIRVTIGRIDVRAVSTPPAAPPPPRSTTPRLSLADYLNARHGRDGGPE